MIMRVFPHRTSMTPDDEYVRIGEPDLFLPADITEVHISVTFSWDIKEAYRLQKAWSKIVPAKIGGPAVDRYALEYGDFIPGKYVKAGCVITSRGCPNKCWFCKVWKDEGNIRELPITPGHNILDSNLLACSQDHINAVFDMLETQSQIPRFTGGIEAARLEDWHIERIVKLKKKPSIFLAFDTPNDQEPLHDAVKRLKAAGLTKHHLSCYCLIGYKGDTFSKAENRLSFIRDLGIIPYAMIYRDESGYLNPDWVRFRRAWFDPQTIFRANKEKALQNDIYSIES